MIIDTISDFKSLDGKLESSKFVAYDFETEGLHHKMMKVLGCAFYADNMKEPVYVELNELSRLEAASIMKRIFSRESLFIAHNYPFDGKILKYFYQCLPKNKYCTLMGAWYLNENEESFKLEDLVPKYLDIEIESDKWKNVDKEDREKFADYACRDAYITYLLFKFQDEKLSKRKALKTLFYSLEMDFQDVIIDMTLTGFNMDHSFLKRMEKALEVIYEQRTIELSEKLGGINLGSWQQLCTALYGIKVKTTKGVTTLEKVSEGLVAPKAYSKKTKAPSTSEKALKKLDHPIVDEILAWREVNKLLNTYAKGYQRFIVDGVIYPNFLPHGTVTGRLSCIQPNMMNLPRVPTDEWFIRDAFVAEPGYKLIVADESQLELRLLAHFSQDPELVDAYTTGADVHERTAKLIVEKDEVTKEERAYGKKINFSVIYGLSYKSLAEDLKIPQGQAKFFLSRFNEVYTGISGCVKDIETLCMKQGYVKTILGRRRRIPEIWSNDNSELGHAKRQAFNSVIQGSAADVLKAAMVKIYHAFIEEGLDAHMISQIHDELVVKCAERDCERAAEIMKYYMENPFAKPLLVPLVVEPKIVDKWSDGK